MPVIRSMKTARGRKLQVIIRKGGHSLSRTFWKTREAEDWGRRVEDAIASATPERPFVKAAWLPMTKAESDARSFDDTKPHDGWTVARAFDEFRDTVSTMRKGAQEEGYRIKFWQEQLGDKELAEVTVEDVQQIVEARKLTHSGDTVRREVNVFRSMWNHARSTEESGWKISGLVSMADLKLPKKGKGRNRRLEDGHGDEQGEEERLRAALATWKRNPEIHLDLFDFALETGMRLDEAHRLTVGSIRRVRGAVSAELPDSKNSDPRSVVLAPKAREIVDRLTLNRGKHEKLFPISDSARRRAWKHARDVAGVEDLRWHDLRHEAVSRMLDTLPVHEVMAQAGHRDMASTKGYGHARASDIARKLG